MKGLHLLIVRTGGSIIDLKSYNCQELGLAKVLVEKGLKVSLVLASDKNSKESVIHKDSSIDIYKVKFIGLNQALSWFEKIESLCSEINADIIQIHEFGMLMSWRIVKWAKKNRTPVVLIQGSYRPTQKVLFKQLELLFNRTFGKYVLKNVSAIGYKTNWAANYIREYSQKELLPSYIGIDTSRFENYKNIDWRERLGIGINTKLLLYVGVVEERRNPHFLVDIIESLPLDYKLVIVGNGPMYSDVENRVLENNLSERCVLLGKLSQEELPTLYMQSDAFLLPSKYEIYGMVILEAMYFSLPVFVSETAGANTIITNGKDGFIFECFEKRMWIEQITRLLNDEKYLKDIKSSSFEKISLNFTWHKTSELFMQLYKSALK